jgi:LmbE family N-acetylglucosaminyl deacetylase
VTPLVVGPRALGTPESVWARSTELATCPPFELAGISHAVIIAPHPDDEILALGGLIQLLARRGATISIVAVTDGEASHPRSRLDASRLAAIRASEREDALERLHTSPIRVTRLKISDGDVTRETGLSDWLEPLIKQASHCFAPWQFDGHPDHDACGRAAELACHRTATELVRYPVWGWHWATPAVFPWGSARRIDLDLATLTAKCDAITAYHSQIAPLDGEVVLPPEVLARFQRAFEVVFV